MRRKNKKESATADSMPSSITELLPLIQEFTQKYRNIKNEQEELKERERELFDEYENKISMKEMKAAIRVENIVRKVTNKDTFDNIYKCLTDDIIESPTTEKTGEE